jgi:hypothetical protein
LLPNLGLQCSTCQPINSDKIGVSNVCCVERQIKETYLLTRKSLGGKILRLFGYMLYILYLDQEEINVKPSNLEKVFFFCEKVAMPIRRLHVCSFSPSQTNYYGIIIAGDKIVK